MSVYVDTAIFEWKGKLWCHLFADNIDELLIFAKKLGLKENWLQKPPKARWFHFDITENVRRKAVLQGAVEVDFVVTVVKANLQDKNGNSKRFMFGKKCKNLERIKP